MNRHFQRIGIGFVFALGAWPLPSAPAARLQQDRLLEFHAAPDRIEPVRSIADWQKRRAEIIAGMEAVMGPFPGPARRVPLDVRIVQETDCGNYVLRQINYLAEPGSRVPAFLLIPKAVLAGTTSGPGALCLMGTHGEDGRLVVGLDRAKITRGQSYGEELALRGYVVISPPYPLLGAYRPDLKKLGYVSGTMKAIWDNVRALDVLAATPGVAPTGFGAIGLSLGGHNAIFTALFDERIRAVVSCCGFDSFLDYRDEMWKPEKGWARERYMPRLLTYRRDEIPFDFQELVGALAPRPLLAVAPLHDKIFNWHSVDRVIAAARPVYQLYGTPERLAVEHPDTQHEFSAPMRQEAYRWFDRYLRAGATP